MVSGMSEQRPSRDLDKIIVRLPDGMRDRLGEIAFENRRSVNAEVVARLEASLDSTEKGKAGIQALTTVHILLDTDGMPTSWAEIHEHLRAISNSGQFNVARMEVHVVTPNMLSSTDRNREAELLAKKYRALARKTK